MRQLRPEIYSDTVDRTTYQLDAPTLGYHLETITARNQTHDFEIFCPKLCERTICANLKPATGPEGGGDSKADTETIPIADEITGLTYVGDANAGRGIRRSIASRLSSLELRIAHASRTNSQSSTARPSPSSIAPERRADH